MWGRPLGRPQAGASPGPTFGVARLFSKQQAAEQLVTGCWAWWLLPGAGSILAALMLVDIVAPNLVEQGFIADSQAACSFLSVPPSTFQGSSDSLALSFVLQAAHQRLQIVRVLLYGNFGRLAAGRPGFPPLGLQFA